MRASSGLPITALPAAAAAAAEQLREALLDLFGDDLVGLWVDGGTTFADRPSVPGDLDVGGALAGLSVDERDPQRWQQDATSRPRRVLDAHRVIEEANGVSLDAAYFVVEEMGAHDRPGMAFVAQRRWNTWPIVRAHWLAGQFVSLHGRGPDELVTPPLPADLRRSLSREVEHLERHVHEGDAADPYEATYAIWTGCRVLHTLATGSPVVSKRSAGTWGLANLPERWHAAIEAAGRSYDGVASDEDRELLRVTMPAFVEMVRARVPLTRPRPPGQLPRWS